MEASHLHSYAARNVYMSIGAWQPEDDRILEQYLAPNRAALGEVQFATAMSEGQSMTMEQAIAFAFQTSIRP
jgi:hypothetical protein